jgi:hypothetical protein
MQRLYQVADDFEATIRILFESEGGRVSSPFNGIRWDFAYASDGATEQVYMIWPDFLGQSGDSIPKHVALPIGVPLQARMTIVSDELRESFHRSRIKPGVEFFCCEGRQRVAIGTVTRISGLHSNRSGAA